MIALKQAVATLDGVIPAPDNKMVDIAHLPIAVAWQECKTALASYSDMQNKHDTLMRRWGEMVETIRRKVDAGTLTAEDRRLLDDLNLPHRYDKRNPTAHELCENPPLTPEELREMDGEPVWAVLRLSTNGIKGGWALVDTRHGYAAAQQRWTNWTLWYDEYGKTWLAYRRRPEVSGK